MDFEKEARNGSEWSAREDLGPIGIQPRKQGRCIEAGRGTGGGRFNLLSLTPIINLRRPHQSASLMSQQICFSHPTTTGFRNYNVRLKISGVFPKRGP